MNRANFETNQLEARIREFLATHRPKDGLHQVLQWSEVGLKASQILDQKGISNRLSAESLGAYLTTVTSRARFMQKTSLSPDQDPKVIALMEAMRLSDEVKMELMNLLLEFRRRVREQTS